ncbi:unnamed protein product [Coregonus sp. 'balchen']|nr:unnamed protein product [Coregonus sp. 'balchen']
MLSDGTEINMGLKHNDLCEAMWGHAVGTVIITTQHKLPVSTVLSQETADVDRNEIASVTNMQFAVTLTDWI